MPKMPFSAKNFVEISSATIALVVGCSTGQAQTVTPPYAILKDTLPTAYPVAGWLESVFQSQVRQCNDSPIPVTLKKGSKSKPVSFVPIRIVNHLDLNRLENPPRPSTVSVRGGSPLAQEFLSVYHLQKGKREYAPTSLPIVVSEGDVRTPLPSFSGAEYSVTCANAVSAAAKIKGGYTLPVASIEAALSGGTSSTTAYTLDFSDGTFYSPIVAMWNGRTPDALLAGDAITPGRLYSTLIFWDWRTANETVKDPEILEQLRGIGIFEKSSVTAESKIEAKAKAAVTLPWVQTEAAFDGSMSRDTRFTSKKVNVGEFTDDNNVNTQTKYFKLPTLTQITEAAREISPFNLVASSLAGLTIFGKQPVPLTYRAVGMPAAYCRRIWEIADEKKSKGYLSLANVSASKDTFGCDFSLTYTPTIEDVKLGVVLKPQFSIAKGDGANGKKIIFAADELRLAAAATPRLVPVWQVEPTASLVPLGGYSIQLEYVIDDDNRMISAKKENVKLGSFGITCAGQAVVARPDHEIVQRDYVGRILRLALTFANSETLQAVAKSKGQCMMGGELELQIKTQNGEAVWIPRNIPTTPLLLQAPPEPVLAT